MCIACSPSLPNYLPNRRRFLALTAAGIATASALGARTAFAAGATTSVTPDEALARLKVGNERYVSAPKFAPATFSSIAKTWPKPRHPGLRS